MCAYWVGKSGRDPDDPNKRTPGKPVEPDKPDKPEGVPIELADCIIRILDYCGQWGINVSEAIRLKIDYNTDQSPKHNREF